MIIINPIGGLCNYLRVIFSYYEYAKANNLLLIVLWRVTDECNGKFLDYFEPVPNINFIYESIEDSKIYYTGDKIHPEFRPNYTYLKLLPHMKELLKARINILENNYISVHIRRTDHISLAKLKNAYSNDNDFINFIDQFTDKNIYIATDNKNTYDLFKTKYSKLVKFDYHQTISNSHRHTTLKEAIIDIYMCACSSNFMGSGYSSFSHFINVIREIENINKLD